MSQDDHLLGALEALAMFAEKDNRGLSIIAERRKVWPDVRDTILKALAELQAASPVFTQSATFPRGLWVHNRHESRNDNFDTVQVTFGHYPTGVVLRSKDRERWGIERGAALVFGQSESGHIVVARYPFVTELGSTDRPSREGKAVVVWEPAAVTRECVLDVVAEFLRWAATMAMRNTEAEAGSPEPLPEPTELN
jgi:hypothetical protein